MRNTSSRPGSDWALLKIDPRKIVPSSTVPAGNKDIHLVDPIDEDDLPKLYGAKIGILGMGRIGCAVARRARAFDMGVIYWNRTRLPAGAQAAAPSART